MDSIFFAQSQNASASHDIPSHDFTELSLLNSSQNGFTEIHKARRYGKWHVLKHLTAEAKDTPYFRQLLKKEFEISYLLNHQGIVHSLGMETVGTLGDCIVQEYIDGETWNVFFCHAENRNKAVILQVLSELCDAIDFIHRHRIIHRDIKPENILITRDGHHPKLVDFGLADRDVYADLKEPAGTPGYASPEQQKQGDIDNRSDIYSLGAIIGTIAEECKGLRRLSHIARRCMASDPQYRYRNAAEVKMALQKKTPWSRIVAVGCFVIIALTGIVVYKAQSYRITTLSNHTSLQQKKIVSMDSTIKSQTKTLQEQTQENKELKTQLAARHQRDSIVSVVMKDMEADEKNFYSALLHKHPLNVKDMDVLDNATSIMREYSVFCSTKLMPRAKQVLQTHGIKPTDTDYQTVLANAVATWNNASEPHLKYINKEAMEAAAKRQKISTK